MLNNTQSIILTGFTAAGLFIFGILDILENFVVLTLLTLAFLSVVLNLFLVNYRNRKEKQRKQHYN